MESIAEFVKSVPGTDAPVGLVAFSVMAFIILKIVKETKEMLVSNKPASLREEVCQSHGQQATSIAELCVEIRNLNAVLGELKESIKEGFQESWQRLRDVESKVAVVEAKVYNARG